MSPSKRALLPQWEVAVTVWYQRAHDDAKNCLLEKDLLFCTGIGRWPLPLPSYLCNPTNALGLSIEEKDLLFCTGTGIGRWPLPLPSYLCNPANALGLSMEENDLLQI